MDKAANELIEDYLIESDYLYEKKGENTWVVNDDIDYMNNIVVNCDESFVIFEVKIMSAPTNNREAVFQKLLELNANHLFSGGYALTGDNIVLVASMPADNMQLEEFVGIIEAMTTDMMSDFSELKQFMNN